MRIAFVVHAYNRRMGHSRYVAELAERYAPEHEVYVFAGEVDEPRPAGIIFHVVPVWKWRSLTYILSFILPATLLVRGRFDIIHAQGLCGLRQHVVTAHMCQRGWSKDQARYLGSPSLTQRLLGTLLSGLEWLIYRRALSPHVIAVSESNRKALACHYRRTAEVDVVYSGTDVDVFHPAVRDRWRGPIRRELGIRDEEIVALYVGDLRKGATPAIEALAKVPGPRLLFVTYSRPTAWVAQAERAGVQDRVLLQPGTAHVERYFAAADFFVFPTFHDSFGLVVTEAMASGLPVIVSKCAGAAELVSDGECGIILEHVWDIGELARALSTLASNASLRGRMGRAAREKILPRTWDRTAEETMAIYRRVLERRHGARRSQPQKQPNDGS